MDQTRATSRAASARSRRFDVAAVRKPVLPAVSPRSGTGVHPRAGHGFSQGRGSIRRALRCARADDTTQLGSASAGTGKARLVRCEPRQSRHGQATPDHPRRAETQVGSRGRPASWCHHRRSIRRRDHAVGSLPRKRQRSSAGSKRGRRWPSRGMVFTAPAVVPALEVGGEVEMLMVAVGAGHAHAMHSSAQLQQ